MKVDGNEITSISFHHNNAYAATWKTWDISDFLIDSLDASVEDGRCTLVMSGNPNIKNIEITGGNLISIGENFSNLSGLTNVVLRLPNLTIFGLPGQNSGFNNCTSLKRVSYDCPKLTSFGQNVYNNCSALEGDVGEFIPQAISNFWHNVNFTAPGVTGTLVLTNLQSLNYISFSDVSEAKITFTGTSLEGSQMFRGRKGSVTLYAPNLTNMAFDTRYVWSSCTITNFTLYLPKVEKVSSFAPTAKTLTFLSAAPKKELAQTMASNFTGSSSGLNKICTIYCSKFMGWQEIADAMTLTEDMSQYKPERCFGVLRDAEGTTRAWLVHRSMPEEPRFDLSFNGDEITVTAPAGLAEEGSSLALCWGANDGGENFDRWENSLILSEGAASDGGVWSVSAAGCGIAAGDVVRVCAVKSYKVVEYVESTASLKLAVNTGVRARTGLRMKTKMCWFANGDIGFCGGRYTTGDNTRMYLLHANGSKFVLGYGKTYVSSAASYTKETDYEIESTLYLGEQKMYVDGALACSMAEILEVDTSGPVSVFSPYYPANGYTCPSHSRCYYLKLWENGNTTDNPEGDLVRDYIPVKNDLGQGALYDKVTGKVFNSTYFGKETTEYLVVGAETGEEKVEILHSSAPFYYASAANVSGGTFNAILDGKMLIVSISPQIIKEKNISLVLASDTKNMGSNMNDWSEIAVAVDSVPYEGGVYRINLREYGITNDFVRPFLAKVTKTHELTYVRTTNGDLTCHVLTGVPAKSGTRIVTRMSWDCKDASKGDQSYIGTKVYGIGTRLMPIHCYPKKWGQGYDVGNWEKGEITDGKVCDVEAKLYVGEQLLKVDGQVLHSGTSSSTLDFSPTATEYGVFACNYTGGTIGLGSVSTCYYLKIYVDGDSTTNPDGTLVRDFVPARRGGVFGLWDKLNNNFHPGVGSCFSGGSVVSELLPDEYEMVSVADAIRVTAPGMVFIVR
jgi:hypothetical protein